MRIAACLLVSIILFGAAEAGPEGWSVGEEKEVSPGKYITYKGDTSGWQKWITESRGSRECEAYKPAKGATGPEPSPASLIMHDLRVAYITPYGSAFGPGAVRVHREYRLQGDRFFTDFKETRPNWSHFDGEVVQFRVVGFNHYSRDMNWVDLDFAIDMTGAAAVAKWVEECAK